MKISFSVLLISCLVAGSFAWSAQRRTPNQSCPPRPPTVPELNVTQYTGGWYQASGIPAFFQPSGTRCIKANYGINDDGTVSVKNTCVYSDGTYREICGYADTPNPELPGELEVHFPLSPVGYYWLLDTDYDNFAAVYSCQEFLGIKIEFAWLLTRERYPTQEVIEAGQDVFIKNGISLDDFEVTDQGEDCVYENPDGTSCDD